MQLFIIAGAEILRQLNTKALRKALNHAQNQPVEPFAVTYGGQRVNAQRVSNHNRIDHGVKLLENVSNHQRERKKQNQLGR